MRAVTSLLGKGRITQGGSTITQQLVRNIYLTHTIRWERKVEEIFIAHAMEREYSKDELLEFYINNIYFSNNFQISSSTITLQDTPKILHHNPTDRGTVSNTAPPACVMMI